MNVCTEPVGAAALCELVHTLDEVVGTTPAAHKPAAVALALAPYLGREDLLRDSDRRGFRDNVGARDQGCRGAYSNFRRT